MKEKWIKIIELIKEDEILEYLKKNFNEKNIIKSRIYKKFLNIKYLVKAQLMHLVVNLVIYDIVTMYLIVCIDVKLEDLSVSINYLIQK